MELTDEEKTTLEMLGLSTEDYQKQFPDKNEAGQPVNFAGQTLDDFYISMLDKNSEYDFAKREGLGSVRPVTAPVPTFTLPNFSDTMSLILELPEMQKDAIEDAYLYATDQGKMEKYEPSAASRVFLTPMIPEEFDIKRKKKKDD